MALRVEYTKQFKRDLKKSKKQKKNLIMLEDVMDNITFQKPLPAKLRDHALSHNWIHHRELHLQGDWLLIYKLILDENLVVFVRLGSHAELFKI